MNGDFLVGQKFPNPIVTLFNFIVKLRVILLDFKMKVRNVRLKSLENNLRKEMEFHYIRV